MTEEQTIKLLRDLEAINALPVTTPEGTPYEYPVDAEGPLLAFARDHEADLRGYAARHGVVIGELLGPPSPIPDDALESLLREWADDAVYVFVGEGGVYLVGGSESDTEGFEREFESLRGDLVDYAKRHGFTAGDYLHYSVSTPKTFDDSLYSIVETYRRKVRLAAALVLAKRSVLQGLDTALHHEVSALLSEWHAEAQALSTA